MVHFHSSQYCLPDRGTPAVSLDAHHHRSLRQQLQAVWYLRLIGDTEGPALITGVAWSGVPYTGSFLAHRHLP